MKARDKFFSNLSPKKIVSSEEDSVEIICSDIAKPMMPVCLGLYGQVNKRIRWMPRRQQAMKDVLVCDMPRGVDK